MEHQRRIRYCIDEEGFVYSEMSNREGWAIPVYQFADFGNDGDLTGKIPMELEKFEDSIRHSLPWNTLKFTRKIPVDLKNRHREFWGMKPLAS